MRVYIFLLFLLLVTSLTACNVPIKTEASYPTRPSGSDKIAYSDKNKETIWGDSTTFGDKLFGEEKEDKSSNGIGVNSFLWRASLDTVSFMPLVAADPFGGVILSDWYENPEIPGERYKVNIYILDKSLRADGVRVTLFKQKKDKDSDWQDMSSDKQAGTDIENAILTRARELRVAQTGRN